MVTSNSRSALPFMPPMNNPAPPIQSPSGNNLVQQVQSSYRDGASLNAFYAGLGVPPPSAGAQGKTEEKTSTTVDLGKTFEALTAQNTSLMGKLIDMSQGTKAGQNDPFLSYMMTELKEMRRELVAAKEHPQQVDPWQAIDTYAARYDGMMSKLKKDLRLPDNLQLGTGDSNVAIQLKNLELEQRQRELQFEEMKHRWDTERDERAAERLEQARRFNMEYQLKVQDIKDKAERSANTSSVLQDLAGAVLGSLDASPGGPSTLNVAAAPPQPPPVYQPTAFICGTPDCKTRIEIPADATADTEVICPTCQMLYGMNPINQPPPPAAPVTKPESTLAP